MAQTTTTYLENERPGYSRIDHIAAWAYHAGIGMDEFLVFSQWVDDKAADDSDWVEARSYPQLHDVFRYQVTNV